VIQGPAVRENEARLPQENEIEKERSRRLRLFGLNCKVTQSGRLPAADDSLCFTVQQ